jgi:hypothetical protein
MSLPNRVDPFGTLFATPNRGQWLGNRGGRFHCAQTQTVPHKPWATKQWICCLLAFKGRQRQVWAQGYTELFFLDEATALAAGHRPCFECRRADAVAFAEAWGRARGTVPPRAPEMDVILHGERLDQRAKRQHEMPTDDLPDGTMIARGTTALLVQGDSLLPWTPGSYGPALPRSVGGLARVLTPPAIVAVLRHGYRLHTRQWQRLQNP